MLGKRDVSTYNLRLFWSNTLCFHWNHCQPSWTVVGLIGSCNVLSSPLWGSSEEKWLCPLLGPSGGLHCPLGPLHSISLSSCCCCSPFSWTYHSFLWLLLSSQGGPSCGTCGGSADHRIQVQVSIHSEWNILCCMKITWR